MEYARVIFMDSDTLVTGPIDDALWGYSNASFAAAPETFPPDTFNAGFMVLTPSTQTFDKLLELNSRVGSNEGGDQGVLNNGLCPQWFTAGPNDPDCGRLPWLFNVEVVQYDEYNTLRKMQGLRQSSVMHFVSDGKPWTVLLYEYHKEMQQYIDPSTLKMLGKQAGSHMLWREKYFRATGLPPSSNEFLINAALSAAGHQGTGSVDKNDVENGATIRRGRKRKLFKRKNGKRRRREVDTRIDAGSDVPDESLTGRENDAKGGKKRRRKKRKVRVADSNRKKDAASSSTLDAGGEVSGKSHRLLKKLRQRRRQAKADKDASERSHREMEDNDDEL